MRNHVSTGSTCHCSSRKANHFPSHSLQPISLTATPSRKASLQPIPLTATLIARPPQPSNRWPQASGYQNHQNASVPGCRMSGLPQANTFDVGNALAVAVSLQHRSTLSHTTCCSCAVKLAGAIARHTASGESATRGWAFACTNIDNIPCQGG